MRSTEGRSKPAYLATTTATSRLLNRSWIERSSVDLLRQRSSECGGKGSKATAPALGGREFDLLCRAGRRRGVYRPLRPPWPRRLLPGLPPYGRAPGCRGPRPGRLPESLALGHKL